MGNMSAHRTQFGCQLHFFKKREIPWLTRHDSVIAFQACLQPSHLIRCDAKLPVHLFIQQNAARPYSHRIEPADLEAARSNPSRSCRAIYGADVRSDGSTAAPWFAVTLPSMQGDGTMAGRARA